MSGDRDIEPFVTDMDRMLRKARNHAPDLSDVQGQAHVKRAFIQFRNSSPRPCRHISASFAKELTLRKLGITGQAPSIRLSD